ncbi:MAG TPA: D-alanyl-D-alanine carboxypeptidase family protein [Blastocatellia bacterium]|nr:D-alanyl-D-alanine carboxypeptidase family protein [Blastocatellia bacterium]
MLYKTLYAGLIVLLAGVFLTAIFERRTAGQSSQARSAQTSADQNDSLVRLSGPAPEAVRRNPAAAAFESAASTNTRLRMDLSWAFGGRSQRGWHLYASLIANLIGSEEDSSSSEFAMSLARWQTANGINKQGILDHDTWSRMVSIMQSRRIKERTPPPADRMVTAPASDFYDPSRPDELRQVERQAYDAYRRMVRAAAADPSLGLSVTADGELAPDEKYLKIISSYRSREYQANLRKQSPTSGRAGLAVNSPHFTGRALDIYVGGEPVSTKDENRAIQVRTPVYRWLVKNAARFGFQPYFYEPWHWEYVGQ